MTKDLAAASPLAQEVINARAYAFLDDAPAEERRTRAIRNRHVMTPADAAELARPDPTAIARSVPKPGPWCATRTICTMPWC